jgi:D-alanyl-D-alanine dipeptidase
MITGTEYFERDGRDQRIKFAVPQQHVSNSVKLLIKVNSALAAFDVYRGAHFVAVVSSGYRTPEVNASIPNAAPRSNHMSGSAVDIRDRDHELAKWCVGPGKNVIDSLGLYIEAPSYTPTWVHLQIVPTNKNPFIPY